MARIRPLAAIALAALALLSGVAVRAQRVSASDLTAGFLLNFVRFTEWPPEEVTAAGPLVLCVADADVAASLERSTRDQTVNQHAISVRRIRVDDAMDGCALVFAGGLDEAHARRFLSGLQGQSILTVGDAERWASCGGVIGLFVDNGRMRFAINREAAERAHLHLSAKLLSLAKIVRE